MRKAHVYELKDRTLTITFNENGWVNVRSALIKPVRSKPGAVKRTSRQVRQQGYNVLERRWAQTNTALLPTERRIGKAYILDLMVST